MSARAACLAASAAAFSAASAAALWAASAAALDATKEAEGGGAVANGEKLLVAPHVCVSDCEVVTSIQELFVKCQSRTSGPPSTQIVTWPVIFTTEISKILACATLKGVEASAIGFVIGVTVTADALPLAAKERAVAGILVPAARLAEVDAGRTATTREFGTFPVQRFPP